MYSGHKKELHGSSAVTTNNIMELTAMIMGLKALKEPCEVTICTDSQYAKNGITTWIHGWKKNGWVTSKKEPVKNKELWVELDSLISAHKVTYKWVKGHASDTLNNRADELANMGAVKK